MSPIQAQIVRSIASPAIPLPGVAMKRITVKISIRIASTAVIIAGVTPTSRLMFASRIDCQTINRDRQQPGEPADACPHADADVAREGLHRLAEVQLEPVEERDDEERNRRSEHDLCAVCELRELVHFATFSFLPGATTLAFLRLM